MRISKISVRRMGNKTSEKIKRLNEKSIDKLMKICNIGILNAYGEPLDREEKVLILSTEPEIKIINGLRRLIGKK